MARSGFFALGLLLLAAGSASSEDAVIMRDGFTVKGKVFKEREAVIDSQGGTFTFPRLAAFDVVEVGSKFYFYSTHSRKGAEIEKDVPKDKAVRLTKHFPGTLGRPLPGVGELRMGDFNSAWRRTMEIGPKGGGAEKIDQIITYMDPQTIYVVSTTHRWRHRSRSWLQATSCWLKERMLLLVRSFGSASCMSTRPAPARRHRATCRLLSGLWLTGQPPAAVCCWTRACSANGGGPQQLDT